MHNKKWYYEDLTKAFNKMYMMYLMHDTDMDKLPLGKVKSLVTMAETALDTPYHEVFDPLFNEIEQLQTDLIDARNEISRLKENLDIMAEPSTNTFCDYIEP